MVESKNNSKVDALVLQAYGAINNPEAYENKQKKEIESGSWLKNLKKEAKDPAYKQMKKDFSDLFGIDIGESPAQKITRLIKEKRISELKKT